MQIKKKNQTSATPTANEEATTQPSAMDDFEEVSWETLAHLTNGGSRTNRDKKYDAA